MDLEKNFTVKWNPKIARSGRAEGSGPFPPFPAQPISAAAAAPPANQRPGPARGGAAPEGRRHGHNFNKRK